MTRSKDNTDYGADFIIPIPLTFKRNFVSKKELIEQMKAEKKAGGGWDLEALKKLKATENIDE